MTKTAVSIHSIVTTAKNVYGFIVISLYYSAITADNITNVQWRWVLKEYWTTENRKLWTSIIIKLK